MKIMPNTKNVSYHSGFSLVELIVALAIGLIVSAAALQLFTGGLITTRMQEAGAELQDSGIFGLEYMARDIRLANYGNHNNPVLNNTTSMGGIVLTSGDPTKVKANLPLKDVDEELLTKSGGSANATGSSDQLTIQFVSPNKMVNCEGKEIEANRYVIQRYFLRKDGQNLALACDANDPASNDSASVAGLKDTNNGQIIMPRVDQLRFYLGSRLDDKNPSTIDNLRYYTIDEYKKAVVATNPPRIVSIKIVVLVRSRDSIKSDDITPAQENFSFPDGQVAPTDKTTKYLRRLYTTTIALRNGLGEKIYESEN